MIDNTDVKEYLRKFRYRALKIELLTREIERLNTIAESTSISYNEKVQCSQSDSAELLAKLVDKKDELLKEKQAYLESYMYIDRLLNEIGSVELECIIRLRYFDGLVWEDIAEEMKYSIRWIHHLHGKAISKLQNAFSKKK